MQTALINITKHRQVPTRVFYPLTEGSTENTAAPAAAAGASPLVAMATYTVIMDSKEKKTIQRHKVMQFCILFIFKAIRKGLKSIDFPARVKTQLGRGPMDPQDRVQQSHCCPEGRDLNRKQKTPKPIKKITDKNLLHGVPQ